MVPLSMCPLSCRGENCRHLRRPPAAEPTLILEFPCPDLEVAVILDEVEALMSALGVVAAHHQVDMDQDRTCTAPHHDRHRGPQAHPLPGAAALDTAADLTLHIRLVRAQSLLDPGDEAVAVVDLRRWMTDDALAVAVMTVMAAEADHEVRVATDND